MMPDTKKKLSPDEQRKLNDHLIEAVGQDNTQTAQILLASGADIHHWSDQALRRAACAGHRQMVDVLLAAGANVHAEDDWALCWATYKGHMQVVQVLAQHIFAPNVWRGHNRSEVEMLANALYDKIKASDRLIPIKPKDLRKAGTILVDCALQCWEQIRPAPPKIQISPLAAQPRAL